MEKENTQGISRREFIKLSAITSVGLMKPDIFKNSTPPKGEWPTLAIEKLPKEVADTLKNIQQTEINEQGYLVGKDVQMAEASAQTVITPEKELENVFYQSKRPMRWTVVLQNAASLDDLSVKSHFGVTSEGIRQFTKPGPKANPLTIWNLSRLDRKDYQAKGNPYVKAMNVVKLSDECRTENFDPLLVELYDGPPVSIARRAINVRINGNLSEDLVLTKTLSLIKALGKYNISPWQVVSNLEIYGFNRDLRYDIGVPNMIKLRHYMGLWALSGQDNKFKKQVFGDFIKDSEGLDSAVKRYFAANREYLLLLTKPKDVQEWDAETKYHSFKDDLDKKPDFPTADEFVRPVKHNSGGGYHFGEQIHDKDDPNKLLGLFHTGYDFNVGGGDDDLGLPFWPVANGEVVYSGFVHNGLGNIVIVRHRLPSGSEIYSRYCHLNDRFAKTVGQVVTPHDIIGTIGMSGGQKYAHLHVDICYSATYEMYMKDRPWFYPSGSKQEVEKYFIDPIKFIDSFVSTPRNLDRIK